MARYVYWYYYADICSIPLYTITQTNIAVWVCKEKKSQNIIIWGLKKKKSSPWTNENETLSDRVMGFVEP